MVHSGDNNGIVESHMPTIRVWIWIQLKRISSPISVDFV